MRNRFKLTGLAIVLAGLVLGTAPLAAQETNTATGPLVRVTVNVVGHTTPTPTVTSQDVLVYQDEARRAVVDWVPIEANQNAGLDLAVVVDDSIDSSIGLQLKDIAEFIRNLPAGTRVAVAYARNGTAPLTQGFTTDRELAAKALRLPTGEAAGISSPSLALIDLMKRWPDDGNRHEVLLVSSGIDLFRGVVDSAPGLNPDLDRAIRVAQREGVMVHTIFADGAGRIYRNPYLITNGQGSLLRLAYETGGEAYFQGSRTPVNYTTFLNRLSQVLDNQYLLTFRAEPMKKAGYARLKLSTEVPGVELVGPEQVYVSNAM